ncbi:MAG: FAD-dependent oxidoreductase [Candidatus Omnitrophica bacterium]|nr:FAD-dependent oxidoreductase [Candidatus Omnitrophota bacterium]
MKRIVIIGGGFAGVSALFGLRSHQKRLDLEVTLINDKQRVSFLPMLPDCLGRNVSPENLLLDLAVLSAKMDFNFIQDRVSAVDLLKKQVTASALTLGYDFLLISSGTETNFYNNNEIRERAFKLDDASDALLVRRALEEKSYASYLIAGAGYTGIEVATNLRVFLKKRKIDKKIVIIERAPSILGPLPQWMKDYVADNLKRLNIEVLLNSSIERVEENRIRLSGGEVFENSMLIWAAGVRTADFIRDLKVEKNPQGRINTDEYLRVNASCFAAGDTAYYSDKNNFLRMAVQFAIMEGTYAAKNIIRSLEGKRLAKFKPLDFGYIIPMANNRACGIILGINMKGFLPLLLHYFMCIYRSYGLKNKSGIVKDLIKIG